LIDRFREQDIYLHSKSTVGASLLAKAFFQTHQAKSLQDDMAFPRLGFHDPIMKEAKECLI
jgi:hypothetical protein